ncbi:transcriptional regulator FnrL [uncultured Amaricoccus sp.]|uniref:transcriptional regulator FnrL n=1 Tax=uncultured Amaricoccus sp. TaxID=339341 RepID=UPI002623BB4B|nr:Crp/Fnr family transcriptional regulator [uncultured Amaricoccus sp.]
MHFPAIRTACAHCSIRERAVCACASPAELEELNRIKSYRSFAPGETIAWAGETMPLVGSVVEGVATLALTLADGRRQMVGLLLPADFLGRPGRTRSSYDVVAATEITLCMFRRAEFERLLRDSPRLGQRLLDMTLDELEVAREWMLLLGRKTARERIASLLVIMARRQAGVGDDPTPGGASFPLHITREAMADYLGLTIETVSRQISALRREGQIRLCENRMVEVPNLDSLVVESGGGVDPAV